MTTVHPGVILESATGYRPDRDWDHDGDVDLDDYDIVPNNMSDDADSNTTQFRTGLCYRPAGGEATATRTATIDESEGRTLSPQKRK